jgi:hypothetical protein
LGTDARWPVLIQINPAILPTTNSAVHKAGAIGRLGDAGPTPLSPLG